MQIEGLGLTQRLLPSQQKRGSVRVVAFLLSGVFVVCGLSIDLFCSLGVGEFYFLLFGLKPRPCPNSEK